jgi:hypothetical protein
MYVCMYIHTYARTLNDDSLILVLLTIGIEEVVL